MQMLNLDVTMVIMAIIEDTNLIPIFPIPHLHTTTHLTPTANPHTATANPHTATANPHTATANPHTATASHHTVTASPHTTPTAATTTREAIFSENWLS